MFSNLNLYITIMIHATISFQRLVLKKIIFNISFLDHNYRKPLIRILKDSFVPFKIKGFGAIRGIYGHIFYEFQKILYQNFVSLLKKLFTPCCSFLILLWRYKCDLFAVFRIILQTYQWFLKKSNTYLCSRA
jgi:hypothetical protein